MIYAGIDYSMTSPAIVTFDESRGDFSFQNCQGFFLTSKLKDVGKFGNVTGSLFKPFTSQEERFEGIARWALETLANASQIALEGYAMGAKGKVFDIAENGGVLKNKLWTAGKEFQIVAPTELKKFACGKGKAPKGMEKKEYLYQQFVSETGYNLKGVLGQKTKDTPSSDIVDAFYLCKFSFSSINCERKC